MKSLLKIFIPLLGAAAVLFLLLGFYERPYAPVQPVKFSHKIHAGDFQMNCLYCHSSADRSPSAGIPSVQRCIGCHKIIAADKPQVKKIQEYWEKKEPIPWVRVYKNPDYVYFSHRRHVSAGFQCERCHGEVKEMKRIIRTSSLGMGWCVKCHKKNSASRDCLTCHQ